MHCPCPAQEVTTPFHSVPQLSQMDRSATGDFQSGDTDLPSPTYLHQCNRSLLNPILALPPPPNFLQEIPCHFLVLHRSPDLASSAELMPPHASPPLQQAAPQIPWARPTPTAPRRQSPSRSRRGADGRRQLFSAPHQGGKSPFSNRGRWRRVRETPGEGGPRRGPLLVTTQPGPQGLRRVPGNPLQGDVKDKARPGPRSLAGAPRGLSPCAPALGLRSLSGCRGSAHPAPGPHVPPAAAAAAAGPART